jgi:hypothetical protein
MSAAIYTNATGSDLTRGSSWPATDLKNPHPRLQR